MLNLKWSPVKFYGSHPASLLDELSTKILIHRLQSKYGLNTEVDFKSPGFKYYKFLKDEDVNILKSYRHLVTPHYGLNPVWLLWFTQLKSSEEGSKQNYSLYVNLVTQQIIWSCHRMADQVYQENVILEGEIFKNKFLIWDLLVKKGQPVFKMQTLYQRLDRLRGVLNYQYQPDPLIENLSLKLRPYVEYPYLKSFQTRADAREQKGLLFIPLKNSTRCFTLMYNRPGIRRSPVPLTGVELEKLNPVEIQRKVIDGDKLSRTDEDNSEGDSETKKKLKDFWIQPGEEPDNYILYSWTDNLIYRHDRALISSREQSEYLRQMFQENAEHYRSKSGIYPLLKFKCHWVRRFRKWEPLEITS